MQVIGSVEIETQTMRETASGTREKVLKSLQWTRLLMLQKQASF